MRSRAAGETSHVAIMAASMGIPTLVAVGPELARVPEGAPVILDGEARQFAAFPEAAARADGGLGGRGARAGADNRARPRGLPAGRRHAHRGRCQSRRRGRDRRGAGARAEGCGLLRSEFLFIGRVTAPTRMCSSPPTSASPTGCKAARWSSARSMPAPTSRCPI